MTIGTGAQVEFFGAQTQVTSAPANVTDGSFSPGFAWTNSDDAPMADVVLQAAFAVPADANGRFFLHLRKLNIVTTSDEPVPSSNWQQSIVGTILVENVTAARYPSVRVALRNHKTGQEYEWYVENNSGQTLQSWELYVTPVALGPHA